MGYFGDLWFTALAGFGYLIVDGAFLLLFISICMHHQAFFKMFEHTIDKTNESDGNRCDAKFLRDLIRFHTYAKE